MRSLWMDPAIRSASRAVDEWSITFIKMVHDGDSTHGVPVPSFIYLVASEIFHQSDLTLDQLKRAKSYIDAREFGASPYNWY